MSQGAQPTASERINRACYVLMTDPELAPLLAWWEGEALRSVLPPGPADTSRLLMAQGDRERLLSVMGRANAHRAAQGAKG